MIGVGKRQNKLKRFVSDNLLMEWSNNRGNEAKWEHENWCTMVYVWLLWCLQGVCDWRRVSSEHALRTAQVTGSSAARRQRHEYNAYWYVCMYGTFVVWCSHITSCSRSTRLKNWQIVVSIVLHMCGMKKIIEKKLEQNCWAVQSMKAVQWVGGRGSMVGWIYGKGLFWVWSGRE